MRLEATPPSMLAKAVETYLAVAWGDDTSRRRPHFDFSACTTAEEVLSHFTDERRQGKMRRWTLRLGNRRYPFMKLVFQELLVRDDFFFAVDTHDDLELHGAMDDFDTWLTLRRQNAELKLDIERAWQREGVPTFANVVAEMERAARPVEPAADALTVLVVDDDVNIAAGVESVLTRQGYRVSKVHRVADAMIAIARQIPDLIISDLEMPEATGLDLATKIRSDPSTKDIPFILATAASIDASNFRLIDGFVVKPFETEVLLAFVKRALRNRRVTRGGPARGES